MGLRQDTEESLKDFEFTKIDGQPSDEDLTRLVRELTNAAASIPTTLGGGNHGHVGMIIPEAEYITFSNQGAKFETPKNPGAYPRTVDETNAAVRERQMAEHKAEQEVFHIHEAVASALRKAIVSCVDDEWLAEIHSETMGYNHRSPKEMILHLRTNGGDLDHMDVTELTIQLQKPWDLVEAPATYFARGDRIEQQLVKAGQTANPMLRLAFILATVEGSGEYESSLREWNAKSATVKTFSNFRVYFQSEFAKKVKHNKTSAQSVGRGISNTITDREADQVDEVEAAAIAIAEVANAMQAQQNKQFEQMMELMKTVIQTNNGTRNVPIPPPPPANSGGGRDGGGGGREGGSRKKRCPHCKWMVYHKPEKCYELEANAAKRPAGWKSVAER